MIDASFIQKISDMAAEVNLINIDGVDYATKPVHKVSPPCPDPMVVYSLDSIKEYCMKCGDSDMRDGFFIRVDGHDEVSVVSPINPAYQVRKHFIKAELASDQFHFNRHMDVDKFVIGLQALFTQDETTAAILRVVGNITAKAEHKTMDDGTTQSVTVKTGIARAENAVLPNPVILCPFRTFPEVKQPASRFVLRINAKPGETPTCGLWEADGGMWEVEAIKNIKEWFKFELPDVTVI